MDSTPELILKPNYPGLLTTALLMGSAVYLISRLLLFFATETLNSSLDENKLLVLVIAFPPLLGILVVCIASLLDILRTAMTGMRQNWRVSITQEGIRHPLLSARPIPWKNVEAIAVVNGYNGKDIWFTLDPSVQASPLFSGLISLLARQRVSYLRLLSHRFEIDTAVFLRALQEIVPERLEMEFRIT
jgi:hypothetical protein